MRIGIGIDTGGTYTDAVLYDFDTKKVLAKNKSLTTKEDLSIGIKGALQSLPKDLVEKAALLSVSTTLATNACVEQKGGRAKLLLVGTSNETLQWLDAKNTYGLQNNCVFCVKTEYDIDLDCQKEIDWNDVLENGKTWFSDAQAIALVAKNAVRDGSIIEKKAKDSIKKVYNVPTIMASEVANNLNMLERGATALLNARLLSVVEEFVEAISVALSGYNLQVKKMIVRSDGSLMAHDLILKYPVKTILSGPAASVIGAMSLAVCNDSLVIDMGGTTTDISIVANGKPTMTKGISIGGYRTQIQGVHIDTFSLGGDTRIVIQDGEIVLDNRRVMPLCALAKKYPSVKEELENIVSHDRLCGFMYYEFLYLVKQPKNIQNYDEKEIAIIESLQNGPVSMSSDLRDLYKSKVSRLESEGIVMRAGLTPTDFMHIKGDFSRYDREASVLGAQYLLKVLPKFAQNGNDINNISDFIYNLVCKTLYINIIKTACMHQHPSIFRNGFDSQFLDMLEYNWDSRNKKELLSSPFTLNATLVGIGAPIHIFLHEVAIACNTNCIIPEHAEVANALGAIIADINAESKATISPIMTAGGVSGYNVHCEHGTHTAKTKEDAVEYAKNMCENLARVEAENRGAIGELTVCFNEYEKKGSSAYGEVIDLGLEILCSVTGRV